ncbi:MAG: nitrous oxide reductase family maturation protein NosD [Promethearchaeota archaeon]
MLLNKNILAIGIVFLFVCSAFIPMSLGINTRITNTTEQPSTLGRGKTLYVGGSGEGNYTTIQDAIDNASHGDTVFVFDDSSPYYERVTVKKAINLIGEDKNTTVIESNESWSVIGINWYYVNFSGFTIRSGIPPTPPPDENCGIVLWFGENCNISGNIITNAYYGILTYSAFLNRIYDNILIDNNVSICTDHSFVNYIYQNNITKNEVGIGFAIHSGGNFVYENIIWNNERGIYVSDWGTYSNHSIFRNNILDNQIGIEIHGFDSTSPENNHIYQNNFIGNIQYNALITGPPGSNYWDGQGVGNYWDDYTGKDKDGNGIGDTPYIIKQAFLGKNKDNYPLMEAYTGFDSDAPDAPTINGPHSGKVGEEYEYTFVTTDPNGDDVHFYITWGDGTFEKWIGPFGSGEEVKLNHTWTRKSSYCITAQAKDTNGLIGPWGTLMLTMPRNRATYNSLFLRFLEQFPILHRLLSLIRV